MIKMENLRLVYNNTQPAVIAFSELTLEVATGSTTVLIGPSGCGKTSLLYVLAGLKQPSGGKFSYLDNVKEEIGIILQDYGLFPWKTVEENIILGMRLRKFKKETIEKQLEDYLDGLQLTSLRYYYPGQLSGGQKQRVALARSLVLEPKILLMDEPFSSLDALTREQAQEVFLKLKKVRPEMTVILVTHSIEEAVYLGDRLLVFSSSPGRIIADIHNDHVGSLNYRQSNEFFELTNKLRDLLKGTYKE